ncbi:MAG: preprotein translocase subunit SecG [Limisphaerales bacterium]
MGFLIGLLTVILVLNCLVLILLILIQLPKKEAGAGTAFGGGATDALFGAGTGNALTNLTKYAATLFFVLAIGLSLLNTRAKHRNESGLLEALKKQATKAPLVAPPPVAPPAISNSLMTLPGLGTSNSLPTTAPSAPMSNKTATPAPLKPAK